MHAGTDGPFSLLSFRDEELLPDVAYQEYAVGGHVIDDEAVVSQLDRLFSSPNRSSDAKREASTMDDLPPAWRKSTFSNSQGACVEVADLDGCRAVRDSKDPAGPALTFTAAEWSAFTAGVRTGEFD